jgi:hypothetical protein
MWRKIVEPGRPQMTVWRMAIECWMPEAKKKHKFKISNIY